MILLLAIAQELEKIVSNLQAIGIDAMYLRMQKVYAELVYT